MREEKKHAEVGKRVRNTRKDQSKAGVINFILTGLHAACMHCMQSACRAVKIELKPGLILMRVPDAPQSALIIRMFLQSPLTALHASCMHCMQTCQDCVCCLKSKSLSDMCLPDPYPMQVFLWKGGSTCKVVSQISCYLYIYKIEAKKVLGNATTHRALVLSSWNFNTDPAQYGRWTLVKIIWFGPRVPVLGSNLGRALSFEESFEALKWDFAGKLE